MDSHRRVVDCHVDRDSAGSRPLQDRSTWWLRASPHHDRGSDPCAVVCIRLDGHERRVRQKDADEIAVRNVSRLASAPLEAIPRASFESRSNTMAKNCGPLTLRFCAAAINRSAAATLPLAPAPRVWVWLRHFDEDADLLPHVVFEQHEIFFAQASHRPALLIADDDVDDDGRGHRSRTCFAGHERSKQRAPGWSQQWGATEVRTDDGERTRQQVHLHVAPQNRDSASSLASRAQIDALF